MTTAAASRRRLVDRDEEGAGGANDDGVGGGAGGWRPRASRIGEIARRLGMNRRTVARLAASAEPPRYRRAPAGSKLDPLEPVMRAVLAEWPTIKAPRMTEILREHGYDGSVDVVARSPAPSCARPPCARPSAPATGPARWPSSTGPRCRRRPRILGARAAHLRAGGDAALLGRPDGPLLAST